MERKGIYSQGRRMMVGQTWVHVEPRSCTRAVTALFMHCVTGVQDTCELNNLEISVILAQDP